MLLSGEFFVIIDTSTSMQFYPENFLKHFNGNITIQYLFADQPNTYLSGTCSNETCQD